MSPVIILGLVVMWAVVLVPMWLRRHDEVEETRSVDQFSTAMRTLSRRATAPVEGRYVVMPHRSRSVDVHVSGASAQDEDIEPRRPRRESAGDRRTAAKAPTSPRRLRPPSLHMPHVPRIVRGGHLPRLPHRASRSLSGAERRRRTLLRLLILTVITLLVGVLVGGVAVWLLQLAVDACLVAFVVHLRRRATRSAAASRQSRRAAVAPVRSRQSAPAVARRAAPVSVDVATGTESADIGVSADIGLDASAWEGEPAQLAADVESDSEAEQVAVNDGWDPVPVPPPTYTMKPAAPARRRRKAPLAEPVTEPYDVAPPADETYDEDDTIELEDGAALDDILTHRWAVND